MKYELKLVRNFNAPRRNRAGVTIPNNKTVVVDLDKEQVKAIKADPMIEMKKAKKEAPVEEAPVEEAEKAE